MAKQVYYTDKGIAFALDGAQSGIELHPHTYWTHGPYLKRIRDGYYEAAAALLKHYLLERCDLTTLTWNTHDKYQDLVDLRDYNVPVGVYMLRIGVCYAMANCRDDAMRWFDMASTAHYHYDKNTVGEDGTDHIFALHYNYVHRNVNDLRQLFTLQKQMFGECLAKFFIEAAESHERYWEVFGSNWAIDKMFSLFPETFPRPLTMVGSGGESE